MGGFGSFQRERTGTVPFVQKNKKPYVLDGEGKERRQIKPEVKK
jgi:hypothetical protein